MLVLDLPPSVEKVIVANAAAQDVSVSQYILSHLPQQEEPYENLAWIHGKDLFGCWESGDGTLSQNVKTLAKQKVFEKYGKNPD